ncbi:hypothetical protein Hamer_G006289 [Homarus americanus]|uniref:Uncharacterized protein n=1 Tax=Homarus americanus TaxID=6706 RepID=A0A8J5JK88_HOMAM|nr:hypothetical protein Hamer_G006289 [Homarus americanus]
MFNHLFFNFVFLYTKGYILYIEFGPTLLFTVFCEYFSAFQYHILYCNYKFVLKTRIFPILSCVMSQYWSVNQRLRENYQKYTEGKCV